MSVITKSVTVDCSLPNRLNISYGKQADVSSRFLNVTITDNNNKISIPITETVIVNCKRADEQTRSFYGTVESDGTVTIPVPNWLLEKSGGATVDISVLDTSNEVRLTTLSFNIMVEKCVNNTSEPSPDDEGDVLIKILNELDDKLEVSNIIAGDNITLETEGNDITINANAGTSVTVDDVTLENDNGILKVKNSGIDSTQIKNSAITNNKIADFAITSEKINNNAVTNQKLAVQISNEINKIATKQDALTAGAGISISNQNVISATASITFSVVEELPESGNTQTIYLVPNSGSAPNIYDEYIWVNSTWEMIGTTEVDLSDYYTKTQTDTLLSAKQGTLTAGTNISISGDTISATDTTYTAGTGIDITSNAVSVDFTDVQGKLTAGDGIAINNGTISAINPELVEFVTTKPSSNIDTNKYYKTLNAYIYPDASDLLAPTTSMTQIIISKVGDVYKAVTSNHSGNFFDYNGYIKEVTSIQYQVVNGAWVQQSSTTDTTWATFLGITAPPISLGDIKYCNHDIHWEWHNTEEQPWNSSMNTATIDGITTDTSLINPYSWIANKYVNGSWVEVGECNYEELFSKARLNNLIFENITVATTDWVSDSTYSDLPYKAVITCQGVTSSMIADVYLASASADLHIVADFCDEGTNSVTIYSTSNESAVTIKRIEVKQ